MEENCTFKGRVATRVSATNVIQQRIIELVADHTDCRTTMMELILLLQRSNTDLSSHLESLEKEGFISPMSSLKAGGDFFAALLSYDITGEGRKVLADANGPMDNFPIDQLPLLHHMI